MRVSTLPLSNFILRSFLKLRICARLLIELVPIVDPEGKSKNLEPEFESKASEEKNNYLNLASNFSMLILKDIGQDKINELNKIDDFNYSPKR